MIAAIPNQPVNFLPSALLVNCPDKRLPLIAKDDDEVRFQVAIEAPTGDYAYNDAVRDWDPGTDWGGPGSWVSVDGGGVCAPSSAAGAYLEPLINTYTPTVGDTYSITIDVVSVTGTVTFSMGGQSVVLSAPGLQTITITAATADAPRITLDNASSRICIERIRLYEALGFTGSGCLITVEVIDATSDDVLFTASTVNRPELFTIANGIVGVLVPMSEVDDIGAGSCVFIRVTDSCDDGSGPLCSQPISIDNACVETVVIRACLDYDALGFAAPGIFQVRLKASLIRPRWEVDASEERWSDGTINRYYVDRQRTMDLLIQPVDESLHPFIATLSMFDHVYIDGTEYVVGADGYDPGYGDQTGTAGAQLKVRPKRELLRRVNCDAPGEGCAPSTDPQCPPPNVKVSHYYDCDGGGYFVEVIVYSALGFVPDRIIITENGAPFDMETWSTPTSYLFGPFALSSLIGIEVTNLNEPSCDWSTSIQLPTCEGPGFGRFATVDTDGFDVILDVVVAEPPYVTLRSVGAFGLGGETVIDAGVSYPLDGSPVQQEFCFYGSDADGNPLDTFSTFMIGDADLVWVDLTNLCWLAVIGVGKNFLTSLDMSGNPYLGEVGAEVNLITSIVWPPGPTALLYVNFNDNAGLTVLPSLSSSLIDDASQFNFNGCALDQDSVDMLITACFDSGKINGILDLTGGTNAPLPLVGPIAAMIATLNGARGWNVTGN